MMYIKYKLDRSKHHGIGLFADQNVNKGQVIYSVSRILDTNITKEQFNLLTPSEQNEVKYWGYWVEDEKVWHVDFDVSKFINHSFEPTSTQDFSKKEAYLVATKNLIAGEEITQNYLEFESKDVLRSRGIKVD